MNIFKYFISLLIIFIIRTNCSAYNKLDLQLALLILSAGDHNGNIVKDNDGNYLKINIASNSYPAGKYEVDIADIIPRLAEIKEYYKTNMKKMKKKIDKVYKKLYMKSERLVSYRTGYGYDEKNIFKDDDELIALYTSELFNGYKDSIDNMRSLFETHINGLDLFGSSFNLKLVNGNNNNIGLISLYNINLRDDNPNNDANKNVDLDQFAAIKNSSSTTGKFSYEELNAKINFIKMLESDECKFLHVISDTIFI